MPRGSRLLLERVCYHVINRGNQKQVIFFDDPDKEKFLEILKHYKKKFAFKLFGYCLMSNHIHMIMDPKAGEDLAKIMQGLTQVYTVWFNNKHDKVGRLWQGRFKSMVVAKDKYLLDCIYYIEMNPVRAGLVSSPAEYLCSSYRDRMFGNKSGLLDTLDLI